MWKLGLLPRKPFSGNMCFEISVLVLCSAGTVHCTVILRAWVQLNCVIIVCSRSIQMRFLHVGSSAITYKVHVGELKLRSRVSLETR
jgi:hypothetical protein